MDGTVRTLEREAAVGGAEEASRLAAAQVRAGALVALIGAPRVKKDEAARMISVTRRAANGATWKGREKRACRLYIGIEGGESMKVRARAMRLTLQALGLASAETKALPLGITAAWSNEAGCTCGCSPGYVLRGPNVRHLAGHDIFVDVLSAEPEVEPETDEEAA